MMKRYPAGAEWRKWDLHIHLPGTKLNNEYEAKDGKPDWDRFAQSLESSDVAVFGITDYFSADQTLAFIDHFRKKYPQSEKLLLANVETRLAVTVNSALQLVHLHVLFRDSVSKIKIREFLTNLKIQKTDGAGRARSCSELSTQQDFISATVSIADVDKAFKDTFGKDAEPSDHLIYIVPSNNDGLRAESGSQRKAVLADEIDKFVHAIYGKDVSNSEHYLKTDRFEDKQQVSKAKPVFGGCDAHSFTEIDAWLGKSVSDETTRQVITWVKADPTFEGLQQTLVEPRDRVSLSGLKPDAKDQYKVIKRVTFTGGADFPEEIVFNQNLNAIVGSRSSGKSALLAHIAHATDPDYTIKQQMLAAKAKNESEVGPAAGLSWKSVESTICKVEWADGSTEGGNVIYIPQNWLYQISDSPKEVTAKIRPVLESQYPTYFRAHERLLGATMSANEAIEKAVGRWFELSVELERVAKNIRQIGDKKSIANARDNYMVQIEDLRAANALNAEDLEKFQSIVNEIEEERTRLAEIGVETEQLTPYVTQKSSKNFLSVPGAVGVETFLTPELDGVPEKLAEILEVVVIESDAALVSGSEAAIVTYRTALAGEAGALKKTIKKLEVDNKDLLEKHKANAALDELVKRQKAQQDSLEKIEKLETKERAVVKDQKLVEGQIVNSLSARAGALTSLSSGFSSETRTLDQLTFGVAIGFDDEVVSALSEPFRKNEGGTYVTKGADSDPLVDIDKAQQNPSAFLRDLLTKKQKLNRRNAPDEVAKRILTATPEVRFTAELDQDRIGGFDRSTMTPGKQALFALTLILGEAEDRWALLIDQPEDDLDSRSVYVDIVRYLVAQKRQRQIILVTHNANLVVGADAEEVLVANRHGDDRKNEDARRFDYLTGSLEHSQPLRVAAHDLERMGIREHVVEILDGGEEAFQKRRDKYKL